MDEASDEPGLWSSVPQIVNALSREVIGTAISVHETLGPGLLERPYKLLLAHRLRRAGHRVEVEHPLDIEVDGLQLERAYFVDLVVDDMLVIEVKAVSEIAFPMIAQTKTYLRLGGWPLGLLLNFHPPRLYLGGIRRVVP